MQHLGASCTRWNQLVETSSQGLIQQAQIFILAMRPAWADVRFKQFHPAGFSNGPPDGENPFGGCIHRKQLALIFQLLIKAQNLDYWPVCALNTWHRCLRKDQLSTINSTVLTFWSSIKYRVGTRVSTFHHSPFQNSKYLAGPVWPQETNISIRKESGWFHSSRYHFKTGQLDLQIAGVTPKEVGSNTRLGPAGKSNHNESVDSHCKHIS